jgi:hypothetical protein
MASVNVLDTDIYYGQAFDQYTAGTGGNITVSNKMSDDIFVRVSNDGYSTQSFIVVSKNQSKSFARTKLETIWVSGIKGGPVTTYLGIPGVSLNINNPT